MTEDFTIKDGVLYKYLGKASDVTIPNGIKAIEDRAFLLHMGLKSVKIPNGVKRIGQDAFNSCHNLEYIELPQTLTNIGQGAFSY